MTSAAPDKVANPDHYTAFAIQPLEYAMKNKLPFAEANIIKYVSRWRGKNGVEDLRKARSMLDKLITFETTGSMHGKAAQSELPLIGAAEETSLAAAGLTKIEVKPANGAHCGPCGGTGAADVLHTEPCGFCNGTGRDYPDCSGAPEDCHRCKGSGKTPTLDAEQTKLVREFVKACRGVSPDLGNPLPGKGSSRWNAQAAAYNALPDFLKD